MKLNPTTAANYRDSNGNYLGTGRPPNVVPYHKHEVTTLRSITANPAKPITLRELAPTSGRTRRQFGRRL